MENPLARFHTGIQIHEVEHVVPWHTTREEFSTLIPNEIVTRQNQHWITLNCTIFNVQDEFHFNFISAPDPVFHEIQVCDAAANSMARRFNSFAHSIKDVLGEPTMEFDNRILWHDRVLVLDLSIREVRNTPDGLKYPELMLSFQNSTRYTRHWNNRDTRRPGLEHWR